MGSTSYITNADGEVCQHVEYIPFGETLMEEHLNSEVSPYLFNGKERDAETGFYYYGARYYDPKISLWLGVDPLAVYDPINEVEYYFDGQHNGGAFYFGNLNPYVYCYQNPVKFVDPNGKQNVANGTYNLNLDEVHELNGVEVVGNRSSWWNRNKGWIGTTADIGSDFIPFVGSGKDLVRGAQNGDVGLIAFGVGGLLLDATGVGYIGKSIVKGVKWVVKGVKVYKEIRKVRKLAKSQILEKLDKYLLNMSHPVGGSKADWFNKALGFNKNNMEKLAKQIKFDESKAVFQGNNGYADLYQQVISIKGANGKVIDVPFNFAIQNGSKEAHLVGAIPVK